MGVDPIRELPSQHRCGGEAVMPQGDRPQGDGYDRRQSIVRLRPPPPNQHRPSRRRRVSPNHDEGEGSLSAFIRGSVISPRLPPPTACSRVTAQRRTRSPLSPLVRTMVSTDVSAEETGPHWSGLTTIPNRTGAAMFIETEGTPNPATLKFLPGRDVMGFSTADFASAASAVRSPLATALFALPGVARVFLGGDFITVTKNDEISWQALKPQVLGVDHGPFRRRPAGDRGRRGRHSTRKTSIQPTRRSSTRSRNCSTPGSARRWPATAATSCSAATATASSACTCRARAPAARPPAPR